MKKTKHLITMLTAAALFLLSCCNSLKVSAEEPVTYAVKFLPSENQWRYQENTSTFDEAAEHRELYYMLESLKDGDFVVVYNETSNSEVLELGTVRLGNLTVVQSNGVAVIHTGGIDDCFVLAGASAAINGNITNASVYEDTVCNFGGNVKELNIYAEDKVTSTVGCSGTVEHLLVYSTTLSQTFFDLYNFDADTLYFDKEGLFQTPEEHYSTQPSNTAAAPSPTTVPQQSGSPATDNSEYDAVPKTGETNPIPWLLCIMTLCLIGSYKFSHGN